MNTSLSPRQSIGVARLGFAGSALISTLLMIVVLTIIVTAFMQSMAMERQTARSYMNRTKAELAAQAGLNELITRISAGVADSDYRYVVSTLDPGETTERLQILKFQPGSSTATETPIDLFTSAGSAGDVDLSIVSDPTLGVDRRANWQLIADQTAAEDVGRYAYWVDEANAKQDPLSLLGQATGTAGSRENLRDLDEIPLVTRAGTLLSSAQRSPLDPSVDPKVSDKLLTPQSINQLVPNMVPLVPPANEFDFALRPRTELLTPEGMPRLNLGRLKAYIDGDSYIERDDNGTVIVDIPAGAPLSLEQGPNSPRFLLVKNLLNESGAFPADRMNPWGYGNLEFVTKIFPGEPVQARQFVANLIDYIDSDLIPTSDGEPGPRPSSGSISGTHPPNSAFVISNIPDPPTVLGVEARVENGQVVGHPYITYVGQGFIFNSASTRVVGWIGLAYPWEGERNWRIGTGGYSVEMQVALDGTASGDRGPQVMAESSTDAKGYFLHGWLAQQSSYRNEFSTSKLAPKSYVLFPRGYHPSGFDLANGFFGSSSNRNPVPANTTFTDLKARVELLRVIYTVSGQRYLVQDLRVLNDLPRAYPSPWRGSFLVKLGSSNYRTLTDWHFLGDPRLNFRRDGWVQETTVFPTSSSDRGTNGVRPQGSTDVYPGQAGSRRDPQQSMDSASDQWWRTAQDHFPNVATGYRPSPLSAADAALLNLPRSLAMLSYSEMGFLHAGEQWKTLTLYNDPSRFTAPYDTADWRLLDYIDLGITQPRYPRLTGNPEVEGQINVNAGKNATLQALFHDIPGITRGQPQTAQDLADSLKTSAHRPFLHPSSVIDEPSLTAGMTKDFEKKKLAGAILPAITTQSRRFTAYVIGQSLDSNGRPNATVQLVADIELEKQPTGIVPRVIHTHLK